MHSLEEFHTLYSIGRILTICDQFQIPKSKQPSNYQQHFQLLTRYINNAALLVAIWKDALRSVEIEEARPFSMHSVVYTADQTPSKATGTWALSRR